MRPPTGRALVVLVAVALGAAACGIPATKNAAPFNASPTETNCTGPETVTIYLVSSATNDLAPVRRVGVAKPGDAPLCAVNELNAGPTPDESIAGLRTAFDEIPEELAYLGTVNGTATVQLDAPFLSIAPEQSVYEAFGQIVYTLTGLGDGISGVEFVFDNRPYLDVVLPNGELAKGGIARRAEYCTIGPPRLRCASSAPA